MIFVSIASYQDPELQDTISSMVSSASNPELLHIAVFEQSVEPSNLESSTAKLSYKWVHLSEAKGAGFARSEVQKMYDGEEYFFQIDAHTQFVENWDSKMIAWHLRLPGTHTILSGWPMPYKRGVGGVITRGEYENGWWAVTEPHYTVAKKYSRTWIGSRRPLNGEEFAWSAIALGGMLFTDGSFVKSVPYDPRIAWTAEEFLLSVRAFDAGYDIYGVNEVLLYHNYGRHENLRVWDLDRQWDQKQLDAITIQANMLNFKDNSEYRLKNPDRLTEYMNRVGEPNMNVLAENTAKRLGLIPKA